MFDKKLNVIMNGLCRNPEGVTDQEYAALTAGELGNMMFEGVTLEELEATYQYGFDVDYETEKMFEAITTTSARVNRTMKAYQRALNMQLGAGTGLEALEAEIGKPRTSGGFATLTARFPISDGQSTSIIFHSPSGDPAKITSDDTLVAFRFLMNKKDVTNTVAPAGGRDISLKLVTTKLSNMLERNSEKFQARSAEIKAQNDELEQLQKQIEETAASVTDALSDKEELAASLPDTQDQNKAQMLVLNKLTTRVEKLREQLAGLQAKPEPAQVDDFVSDKIKDLVREMSLAEFQRYAMDNLAMKAADAEQLYNQAISALEADYKKKEAEQRLELLETDPLNMLISDISLKLIAELGTDKVQLRIHKEYPFLSVEMLGGEDKLKVMQWGSKDNLDLLIDADKAKDYHIVKIPAQYTKSDVNGVADKILGIVDKYTPKVVDLSNLPAYGSRTSEDMEVKAIAKETREKIAAAKKDGSLPQGLKVSIKSSTGMQHASIDAAIQNVGNGVKVFSDDFLEYQRKVEAGEIDQHDYDQRFRGQPYSADAVGIKKWIDAQIEAHHWDKSDSMTDYFYNAFYYTGGASIEYTDEQLSEELNAYKLRLVEESKEDDKPQVVGGSNGDTRPLSEVKTDSLLNPTIKADAVKGDDAIWYSQGRPDTAVLNFKDVEKTAEELALDNRKRETKARLDKAKAQGYELVRYKHSRLQGIYILVNSQEQVLTKKGFEALEIELPVDEPVDEPVVDGDEPQGNGGLWYGLKMRPLDLGAQPSAQMAKFLDPEEAAAKWPNVVSLNAVRHGAVQYGRELTDQEVSSFELVPDLDALNASRDPSVMVDTESYEAQELQLNLSDYFNAGGEFTPSMIEQIMASPKKVIMDAVKKESQLFADRNSGNTRDANEWKKFEAFMYDIIENPAKIKSLLAEWIVDEPEPEPETQNVAAQPSQKEIAKLTKLATAVYDADNANYTAGQEFDKASLMYYDDHGNVTDEKGLKKVQAPFKKTQKAFDAAHDKLTAEFKAWRKAKYEPAAWNSAIQSAMNMLDGYSWEDMAEITPVDLDELLNAGRGKLDPTNINDPRNTVEYLTEKAKEYGYDVSPVVDTDVEGEGDIIKLKLSQPNLNLGMRNNEFFQINDNGEAAIFDSEGKRASSFGGESFPSEYTADRTVNDDRLVALLAELETLDAKRKVDDSLKKEQREVKRAARRFDELVELSASVTDDELAQFKAGSEWRKLNPQEALMWDDGTGAIAAGGEITKADDGTWTLELGFTETRSGLTKQEAKKIAERYAVYNLKSQGHNFGKASPFTISAESQATYEQLLKQGYKIPLEEGRVTVTYPAVESEKPKTNTFVLEDDYDVESMLDDLAEYHKETLQPKLNVNRLTPLIGQKQYLYNPEGKGYSVEVNGREVNRNYSYGNLNREYLRVYETETSSSVDVYSDIDSASGFIVKNERAGINERAETFDDIVKIMADKLGYPVLKDKPEPAQDVLGDSDAVAILKELTDTTDDVDALIEALENALEEWERDGTEDDYAELGERASNRITELLEAM